MGLNFTISPQSQMVFTATPSGSALFPPYIGANGNWYQWDTSTNQFVDSGVKAAGTNGSSIASITKTATAGLVDTYTVLLTDGTSTTFNVTNGEQGQTGATGATGNGIASAVLNADYTLTLTFTNGSSYTTPSIRGQQGATGSTGDNAEIILTEYGTSASSSTQPSSWQSNIPTVLGGNFLWTRYTWNNGEYSYMCTRYGTDGSGTGDMQSSVYDSNSAVASAGGIQSFVNSSVATNTANYISNNGQPFTSVAQLEAYTGTVTNNDYAFVTGTDAAGNTYYDRYKATVSGSTITWANEFRLNNSSFTSAQWSAISSGITSALVGSLSAHIADSTIHVTSQQKTDWDNKYTKPASGIPNSDIASASTWSGKQDAITSSTALTVKTLTGGLTYLTSAPSSDNTDGIKIVVLSSTPSTKYNGYLYLITGA